MVLQHVPPGSPTVAVLSTKRTGPTISRRGVLRLAFWSALFASVGGIGATMVNAVYPRNITGFGGPVAVPAARIPAPGDDPVRILAARCWLVNLLPDEGRLASDDESSPGGLVALWQKCPHLGCGYKWRAHKVLGQVFLCPCHLSIYDASGKVLDGPAPRPLDALPIKVSSSGEIEIIDMEFKAGTKSQTRII